MIKFKLMNQCIRMVAFSLLISGCVTSLTGIVESSGGVVVSEDASINLTNLQNGKPTAFVTHLNKGGKFEFPQNLEKGTYLLEALVPGYELYSVKIEIDKSRKVKLELIPIDNINPQSFRAQSGVNTSRGQGGAKINPPKM